MKQIFQISLSGLTFFGLCILLFYTCTQRPYECPGCSLTSEEVASVSFYHTGDIGIFKNDMTGVIDTLHIISHYDWASNCSDPCRKGAGGINVVVDFPHLNKFTIGVWHNPHASSGISYYSDSCNCNGTSPLLQSIVIDGTTYNDIYIPTLDSTKIPNGYRNRIPWKIIYSKSLGFVRFYMATGQTWSKL